MYEPLSTRNPFEVDNAKNLNRAELIDTFIETKKFWRLLEPKNHVVLGSRGSGKTALARMLSHDHLSRLKSSKAKELIRAKSVIGIYIPTNVEWVSALNNKPWKDDEKSAELFFQWKLNLSSCVAFLVTAESCLEKYTDNPATKAIKENEFVRKVAADWLDDMSSVRSINELRDRLSRIEYEAEVNITKARVLGEDVKPEPTVGIRFSTPLFKPLRRGIRALAPLLDIRESCRWLICIDEAEFLYSRYQRILNTYLRAHSDKPHLVFKITTMPYCHYTLNTNLEVPLNLGHDFEYIYIDQDPAERSSGETFARKLFEKRAKAFGPKLEGTTLENLFGPSPLLDPKNSDWHVDSEEFQMLRKYAGQETVIRAESFVNHPKKFKDQISRKIHGALLLKNAKVSRKGRQSFGVYSGWRMIIRCSDGNPRRLIRIFNRFWLEIKEEKRGRASRFPADKQERILREFSKSLLFRVKSEPSIGAELFQLLEMIGMFMHDRLYKHPITTDQITSIRIDKDISDGVWQCIKRAVGLGLLFPNINPSNPDHIPDRDGTFHLAYALAPYFSLPPRREKARSLSSIESKQKGVKSSANQWDLFMEGN